MNTEPNETEVLEDSLAEGIAAVIAADAQLDETPDLADLFLEEIGDLSERFAVGHDYGSGGGLIGPPSAGGTSFLK